LVLFTELAKYDAIAIMEDYEFIVIGAGIAGASAAYELARTGSTLIIEREFQPGYHTTGRSAAVFSEIYGNATIRGLTVGSRSFFASPPAGFCEYPLWKQRKSVMIARPDQMTKLHHAYAVWVQLVPSVRLLERKAALDAAPMLKPDYVAGCVLEPDANDLDVHEIHRGFLRGATRAGAKLVCDAEVRGLSRNGSRWRVRTKIDEFRGNIIINAAGAWGDEIGALAGAGAVGLTPKRRTAILFDPAPPEDVSTWPIVIDADEQFYFKPDAGKVLGSPADEIASPPCDAQPEELDVALAVDRIEQATTFRVERLLRKWAGLRSFVADKSPVVGFDPAVPGFFWLVAQGGYGIQTSPALGRIAAALVRGPEIPDDLKNLGVTAANLSPARLH
jgi:D-arginine dehydrogenase